MLLCAKQARTDKRLYWRAEKIRLTNAVSQTLSSSVTITVTVTTVLGSAQSGDNARQHTVRAKTHAM
jgi:hypothetical protein